MTHGIPSGIFFLQQPAWRWLLVLLGLLASLGAQAQVPAWQAALTNNPASQGSTTATATVADAAGNVYIAGSYTGTVQFGTTVLTSRPVVNAAPDQEAFVAKWNTVTNTWVWAVRAGGAGTDNALSLALSGSTIYVVGAAVAPATFGAMPLGGTAGNSISYVVKLADAGTSVTCLWQHSVTNVPGLVYTDVVANGTSVYVGGQYSAATFSIGGIMLRNADTRASRTDVVLFKLSDSGTTRAVEWAYSFGGVFDEEINGLAVSGSRLYVTGSFTSADLTLGGITLDNADLPSSFSNFNDVFLTALDDAGATASVAWARSIGGANTAETVLGVAVSGTNVYVAGNMGRAPVLFGGLPSFPVPNIYSSYDYLAKLSDVGPSPNFTWTMPVSPNNDAILTAFAAFGNSVYLGVGFSSTVAVRFGPVSLYNVSAYHDMGVVRLDDAGPSGSFVWGAQAGSPRASERVSHLAASSAGVYMLGVTVAPDVTFGLGGGPGTFVLPTGGPRIISNLFGGVLSLTGVWQAVQQPFAGGSIQVTGMATDDCGMVYVTGNFTGRVQLGDTIISSMGGFDMFVAKWNPQLNTWAWVVKGGGPGTDMANGLAVHNGNVYVVGHLAVRSGSIYFSDDAYFGPLTLQTTAIQNDTDAYIVKVSDEGTKGRFVWGRQVSSNGDSKLLTVGVRGNRVYAAGYHDNIRFVFGTPTPTILPRSIERDQLVLRFTDLGASLSEDWVTTYPGRSNEAIKALVVRDSVLYLAGSYTMPTSNSYQTDAYVGKLIDDGPAGRYVWHKTIGGPSADETINAVGVRGATVYVAGSFNGPSLSFDNIPLPNTPPTNNFDGFVAALADAGPTASYTWARRISGTGHDYATALAVSGPDLYVAGTTTSPGTTFSSGITLVSQGGTDAFLYKLRDAPAGPTVEWALPAAGPGYESLTSVVATADQLLVAGSYSGATTQLGTLPLAPGTFSEALLVARLTDTTRPASRAGFSYEGSTFCRTAPVVVPGITGTAGGRFTAAPAGLVLDARTGAVSVAASTVGTYTITYTVGGACPATFTQPFTITNAASAAFAYPAGALCAGSGAAVLPTLGAGATAGSFSARTGLALNAATGAVNPAASTAGTYVVTNTVAAANGCAAATSTATVLISPATSAAFGYGTATLCQSSAAVSPAITGTAGGSFAAGSGLALDASTGIITPGSSAAGTYTVTYSVAGPCPSSSTQAVIIVAAPLAGFGYAAASYCANDPALPTPTLAAGAVAGTFSAPAGLLLNASTGVITPAGSTPGTYTVTNSLPGVPGCGVVRATTTVTISPLAAAGFAYPNAGQLCQGGAVVLPTVTGAAGGRFSIVPATGLLLDATTGALTLAGSTPGSYVVTYTAGTACPASSTPGSYLVTYTAGTACPASSTQTLTVSAPPAAPSLSLSGTPATGLTLTASGGSPGSYQFYLNGTPVPGATGTTLLVNSGTNNGSYTATTSTAAGCVSALSAPVSVVVTATAAASPARSLRVYPNPSADGLLTLALAGAPTPAELRVYNVLGQLVWRQSLPATTQPLPLDARHLPAGVYLLRVGALSQRWVRQ